MASYADILKSPSPKLPYLLLLRGPDGPDKTTIANLQKKKFGFERVAADDFFYKNGVYEYNGFEAVKEAPEYCLNRTRALLAYGKCVVVTNSFITLKELEPYLKLKNIAQITIWRWHPPKYVPQMSEYEKHSKEKRVAIDSLKKIVFFTGT